MRKWSCSTLTAKERLWTHPFLFIIHQHLFQCDFLIVFAIERLEHLPKCALANFAHPFVFVHHIAIRKTVSVDEFLFLA